VKTRQAKILVSRRRRIRVAPGGPVWEVGAVGSRPEGVGVLQHLQLQIRNGRTIRQEATACERAWHNLRVTGSQPLPERFVIPEQEHLVLPERASQRSAELMALERRSANGVIEGVPGVKETVTQKLKRVSMQLIRPRGGHNANLPSGSFPV